MTKKPIHLLVPMSGQGTRYRQAGYTEPKPLIPVSGIPMIERLLSSFPVAWPTHFIMADNHQQTELPHLLRKIRPDASQKIISPHRFGPGYALQASLCDMPSDVPVFVTYCDYGMVWDADHFEKFVRENQCDACLVSYRGFHAHYLNAQQYAYSRLEGERVVEVREKGSFTNNREAEFASTGGYYFRSAKLLQECLAFQMEHKLHKDGEYYTSLTIQSLLLMNKNAHVRIYEIPYFFQWGTPDDLHDFEYWEKTYSAFNRYVGQRGSVEQVLMPMAGAGSRFSGLSLTPKPLISVTGKPMFVQALNSMPDAQNIVCVVLEEIADSVEKAIPYPHASIVSLQSTPPGQALSTEAGCHKLIQDREVIVTSCDHGIVLSPDAWSAFQNNPRAEAAIFTVKNFPGARRKPESYAYVIPCNGRGQFPKVERVSVKKAVSENPYNDNVLVGTFWFRSAEVLIQGIQELKKSSILVNGEMFLDSVFSCLIDLGYTVRMIPLDGYICWGDPDALAESLYWQEVHCVHSADISGIIAGGSKNA